MIKKISANMPGFRTVDLQSGANLILADRSAAAGDKDTTNALGKSTLIEIIDFCLGSNTAPDKGLRIEALQGWEFSLTLILVGSEIIVTRSIAAPNFLLVDGVSDRWPAQPSKNKDGALGFELKKWRAVLAWAFFDLHEADNAKGYRPSARSLISYFIRNQTSADNTPFKYFDNQKTWDIQIHNAFLLGLNWEKAAIWQQLKDQKNALDALKQAIKTGAVDGELASIGELEAERLTLATRLEREGAALQNFQVLPQYREIEERSNSLTKTIHDLVNANIMDKRKLDRYRASFVSEDGPGPDRLEALYKEAGVSLPGAVVKTLADAKAFNEKIIANR